MKNRKLTVVLIVTLMTALLYSHASAGVSQEEANRLKTDLTPMGAEKAGNADGTIPEWTGGLKETPAGITRNTGDFFQDPFADDKVLYSINAQNMDKYADKLNPGTIAMMKRYPDTFRLDVYQTRRTAACPEWVYENTFKNATRSYLTEDGLAFHGAYGGVPFPIPTKGEHLIDNHVVRYNGGSRTTEGYKAGVVSASGKLTSSGGGLSIEQYPYYEKDNTLEAWEAAGGVRLNILNILKESARRKGELVAVRAFTDQSTKDTLIWAYMPGQRRVRRAPDRQYDAPQPSTNGFITMDDGFMFNGPIDRFDWKLIGKKEMYVPYNMYKFSEKGKGDEVLGAGHANPDYVRWELHRVWVLEATLKPGKRHCYGKRVFFLDEDSWTILLKDQYDNRGELWNTGVAITFNLYDIPGYSLLGWVTYDFTRKEYSAMPLMNWADKWYESTEGTMLGDQKMFSPEKLRKLGRR
jgi:hypothetical protein